MQPKIEENNIIFAGQAGNQGHEAVSHEGPSVCPHEAHARVAIHWDTPLKILQHRSSMNNVLSLNEWE